MPITKLQSPSQHELGSIQRVKQCRLIMRLLFAPAKLGNNISAQCDSASFGTVEHILFECARINDISLLMIKLVIIRLGVKDR